jgi:hypothetical protein
MTGTGWWCIEAASSLLEQREREAVLGDVAEAGASVWRGLLDVLGLAIRRQTLHWKSWRPWLAGFGLAWPGSLFLMGLSLALSHGIQRIADVISTRGSVHLAARSMPQLVIQALLLIVWSWTGGFVVGSVSRRTLWASILLCCLPCTYCMAEFPTGLLSSLCLLIFLLPASWGVRQGLRGMRVPYSLAFVLAVSITVLTLSAWNGGGSWLYLLALIWPGWYLVAVAKREQASSKKNPEGASR